MTQVQVAGLIEEAFKREDMSTDNWRFHWRDVMKNGGMDVRANIELIYLRTPNLSESFSWLHPRAQGAMNQENFIDGVREKIKLLLSRVDNG
jgi:hypothetical protein